MEVVKKIIEDVKKNGDKAVRKYTEIFDIIASIYIRGFFNEFRNNR